MQNKIKYISFYDDITEENENRQFAMSAINKIDYITQSFVKNRYEVDIISPSWTNNKFGIYKGCYKKLRKSVNLKLFNTFGTRTRLLRAFKYIFSLLQLCIYLLFNTQKGESIIAYHSVILSTPLLIIKKIKKVKLILEVEEIYSDISKNQKHRIKEYRIFKKADAFIFPTESLNEKLNLENKSNIITYGTYKVEEDRNLKFDDDKIHVVYAGTFDQRKGGALTAVSVAEYLNENYHIHIIGFGSEEEKKVLNDKINEICKKTKCIVSYDGLYRGEEYIRFLQKCHIGLSTQIPNGEYNNTSFPSKVLSYMANGLRVVSIRIKVLENSEISDLLYYYDKDCPKEIAKTIKKIDLSDKYNSREKIKLLDKKFIKNIKQLMEIVNE